MKFDSHYAKLWERASERIDDLGIYRWIVNIAGIGPKDSVWDRGCGPGRGLLRVCEVSNPNNSLILGTDQNEFLLKSAKDRMEKNGYAVNYQYKPMVSIPSVIEDKFTSEKMEYEYKVFDNSSTELEEGKVNLIGNNYLTSRYEFVKGHEFDKVMFVFIGGYRLQSDFDLVKEILLHSYSYLKDNGIFLYVNREWVTPKTELDEFPQKILKVVKGYELIDYGFEESIENYAAALFPLQNVSDFSQHFRSREVANKYVKYLNSTSFENFVDFLTEVSWNNDLSMGLCFYKFRKV